MTGKDMLKGIQNLDANLIEEAEFGKFQQNQAGFSGKKKLLFLLAATLIMGTMTAAAVYTRWSITAQTRYNPSQDVKEQAEKSGLSVMLEETLSGSSTVSQRLRNAGMSLSGTVLSMPLALAVEERVNSSSVKCFVKIVFAINNRELKKQQLLIEQ